MFSKTSVAFAISLSSILVAADGLAAALNGVDLGYPAGMPPKCSGLHTPPVYTPGVPSVPVPVPTHPAGGNPYPPSVTLPPTGHPTGVPTHTPTPTTTVTITAAPTATTISQCNTGGAQCCNTVQKATDSGASQLLGLLGVVVQGVDVLVGLGCTPIVNVVASVNCAQQPVCCSNNNFNGLVNIGCSPISV